jgi:hypothetical protein
MADGGQITLVFRIFEFDLFFGQSIPVNGADQLLIFLQQALAKFLCFFVVHYVLSRSSKNPHGSQLGNGNICVTIALSTDQFDETMSRTGTAREAPAAKN